MLLERWKGWIVEILPAHERGTFPLPAYVPDASVEGIAGASSGDYERIEAWLKARRYILREHPFKPYQVDEPSRLTFD